MFCTLPDVRTQILEYVERTKRDRRPAYTIWASMIGDPCERFLYHAIVDWDKAKPVDSRLARVFLLGQHLEGLGIDLLRKAGWKVTQSDESLYWKEAHLSGKVDCFITWPDESLGLPKSIPVEIKFLAENGIDGLTAKGLLESEHRWTRRYPGQILSYMLLKGKEIGLLLIFGKSTADPCSIWFSFEDREMLDYAESLLQKAERVWRACEKREPPERVDPGAGLCFDCDYLTVCAPPMVFGEPARMLDDRRIEALLEKREGLEEAKREYDEVHKELRKALQGVQTAVIGNWIVEGKEVKKASYVVPEGSYFTFKARRIE